ncbi:MAG: ABC transporter ATP-binding protein, partial [Candidatus Woesearchaeota archaeon]
MKNIEYAFSLRIYWNFLKKYKFRVFFLLFLILIVEASFIIENLVIKVIFDEGERLASGAIDATQFSEIMFLVIVFFIILGIVRAALKFLHIHTINRIDGNVIRDLKQYFFNHIVDLSYNFHTSHKTGSLISKLTRTGSAIERFTDVVVFQMMPLIFKLLITIIVLAFFHVPSAAIIFIITLIFIGFSVIMQNIQAPYTIAANDAEDDEKSQISDLLSNIDSIKYFGKERFAEKRIDDKTTFTRKRQILQWDIYRWMDAGHHLILTIGTLVLLYFSTNSLIAGAITIGTLIFILTSFWGLIGHLFSFTHGMRSLVDSLANMDALFQYEKITNDIPDGSKKLDIKKGTVSYKHITFGYTKKKVFRNLTIDIKAGQKVALVGHSGCGKSTLIKLLYRLYDPQKGDVYIDGINIKDITKESLRNSISIVPQECVLFDDTVYNNILFANHKKKKKEVFKA